MIEIGVLVGFLFVIGTLAVLGAPAARRREKEARDVLFDEIARLLGISRTPEGAAGVVDEFQVSLGWSTAWEDKQRVFLWNIAVADRGHRVSTAISANRRGDPSLPDATGLNVITGDPDLDAEIILRGDRGVVTALMDAQTRRLLAGLGNNRSFSLRNGRIDLAVYGDSFGEDPALIARVVAAALRLARCLVLTPGDVPRRLAQNVRADPLPAVRWQNTAVLNAEFPAWSGTRETLVAALADPNPEIHLRAGEALGEEGFATLAAFVRSPEPENHGADGKLWWELNLPSGEGGSPSRFEVTPASFDERKARALGHLVAHFPRERVLPVVREALNGSDELRVAALAGLAAIGDTGAEPEVIHALASPLEAVRDAAVRTLGTVGTSAAVAPLHALAAEKPLAFALHRAVDTAVAQIRLRIHGAEAGQVSLASTNGEAGSVSLAADGEAGRVTLAARGENAPQ